YNCCCNRGSQCSVRPCSSTARVFCSHKYVVISTVIQTGNHTLQTGNAENLGCFSRWCCSGVPRNVVAGSTIHGLPGDGQLRIASRYCGCSRCSCGRIQVQVVAGFTVGWCRRRLKANPQIGNCHRTLTSRTGHPELQEG